MKNHPRWTCKYSDRHHVHGGKHSCSLCLGAHPPFLCPRARSNHGRGNPNWAIYEKKKAQDENRTPCYEQQQPSQPLPPPPAQDWSASIDTSSSPAQQDPAPAEAAPWRANPGQWISGNLWNLSLRSDQIEAHGPLGSFLRHTATIANPNVPHYVSSGRFPVRNLSDLRTEPTLANVMAHQKYLKYFSFEADSLHQPRERAHIQLTHIYV